VKSPTVNTRTCQAPLGQFHDVYFHNPKLWRLKIAFHGHTSQDITPCFGTRQAITQPNWSISRHCSKRHPTWEYRKRGIRTQFRVTLQFLLLLRWTTDSVVVQEQKFQSFRRTARMPTFDSLKTFWESLSAEWTPFAPDNDPYLLPLHDDRPDCRSESICEAEPLFRSTRETLISYQRVSGLSSNTSSVPPEEGSTHPAGEHTCASRWTIIPSVIRFATSAHTHQRRLYPFARLPAQPITSVVTAQAMTLKQQRSSLPRASKSQQSHSLDSANTPQITCQTLPSFQRTPRHLSRKTTIPASTHCNNALIYSEAHAASNRMLDRNTTSARTIDHPYQHRYSATHAQHDDDLVNVFHTDSEAGTYSFPPCSLDSRQPLLQHLPPPQQTPPSYGTPSPDSYSSGDMPDHFYSPRRMQERRARECARLWRETGVEEWNICLGIYLMGCIVVIAVGAAVVGIWILLHQ